MPGLRRELIVLGLEAIVPLQEDGGEASEDRELQGRKNHEAQASLSAFPGTGGASPAGSQVLTLAETHHGLSSPTQAGFPSHQTSLLQGRGNEGFVSLGPNPHLARQGQ